VGPHHPLISQSRGSVLEVRSAVYAFQIQACQMISPLNTKLTTIRTLS
jgi:hypothetical protein